jgi:hypothetical protein
MIIRTSTAGNVSATTLNLYPDQFVSMKEKQSADWIKKNMDYFSTIAYSQYVKSKDTFVHNYNLVKGILRAEDFYLNGEGAGEELKSFTDKLVESVGLPDNVKHYPILNPPLNTMIGEQSKRPDEVRIKAFDDDSKNEELEFKTNILQSAIVSNAKEIIMMQAAQQGQKIPDDQLEQMTTDRVKDYMTDYTSTAEKWGNRTIECLKVEFNLKEISEDCFRDLLISGREYYHIYENNSKVGFGIENLNPKNVWYLTLPDKKYMKEAYAIGTVHVMELSEILQRFNLTKEEVDELRKGVQELGLLNAQKSNLDIPSAHGWDSIKYDTYSPLIAQQRMLAESMLTSNEDPMGQWLGVSSNVNTFGNKYIVVQAYWQSKIKIGKVTYIDENEELQVKLVDETYKKIPNEVQVDWEYDNRWYKGLNIANRVYQAEPLNILDYSPIIGVVHEVKNVSEPTSFIDLIKPFQIIYNVCINQLWLLLEKEIGVTYSGNIRDVPVSKDGDVQDALAMWEQEARNSGIMWNDDSPENRKAPTSYNGAQSKAVDLGRSKEMQTRYQLAQQMKMEAWELVGITRERTGSVAATQTATGTNAAVSQSYAQTEPYFAQHEYVYNDVCQASLDASQYIETQKPFSTLSYINTEGEQVFFRINTDDLKMRDLKVFATSRSEDKEALTSLRGLSQTILQNGGTPYDVTVLYTTNSIRRMEQVYKQLRDRMYSIEENEQQLKQQEQQQQQQQFEYEQQAALQKDQADKEFESEQNELDRLNRIEVALINAESKEKSALNGTPESGQYEIGEYEKLGQNQLKNDRDYQLKLQKINDDRQANVDNIKLQLQKIRVERERLQAQIAMKKMDRAAKNKASKK